MTLEMRRQFYADEIVALANVRTPALAGALACVPRERFLSPGPWLVKSETDVGGPARQTPDADPRHVYHNLSIAIDPSRQLFNGQPSLVTRLIDTLGLAPGGRVLHVGTGTGYYTALLANTVGPSGRVLGVEVDETLAAQARANLAGTPWVEIVHGDASRPIGQPLDAILVNAGVTHPLASWLDALAPGGRLVLPLTVAAAFPGMAATIGKGLVVRLVRGADDRFGASVITLVAIYSAVGLRDPALEARIGEALKRSPFPRLSALRRDPHNATPQCWLHADTWCLSVT